MTISRILLLHAPFDDYTYPYHSLSYVAAVVESAGFDCDVFDINALWFNSVLSDDYVAGVARRLRTELDGHLSRPSLRIGDQNRVADLVRGLAICDSVAPEMARQVLRSERFYELDRYAEARAHIRRLEALLSIAHPGYDFLNAFAIPPHEPNSERLCRRARSMPRLQQELCDLLRAHCSIRDYCCVGVSMPFSANLLPGLVLLDAVKTVFRGVPRIAGGTAVTDMVKYRTGDETLAPFGEFCEFMYAGEAEVGFGAFLTWLHDEEQPCPGQVIVPGQPVSLDTERQPYVALRPSRGTRNRFVPFDWASHPPRYDWIDWSLYLSPERRINYSPVRGCFWNKCTFCDYGLNSDTPTAPSREMQIDVALDTLQRLSGHGVDHVYLASDALPPSFLRRFAQGLIERGMQMSWSCQLFLTGNFDQPMVQLLQESGLKLASFGLESGSSRVLARMGKGVDRVEKVLHPVLDAFRQSRIAMQPLFFYGFPGESETDRQATVDLLLEYEDLFRPISRGGSFELLAGSMIARSPETFGIAGIRRPPDDNIAGVLDYTVVNGDGAAVNGSNGDGPEPACNFHRFSRQLPYSAVYERPWIGGVDTFHSHLWIGRFGRQAFDHEAQTLERHDAARCAVSLASQYDLQAVIENVAIQRALQTDGFTAACGDTMAADIRNVSRPLRPGPARDYSFSVRPLLGC